MTFTLLNELQQLTIQKKNDSKINLAESVDKFLGHLFTSLSHKQDVLADIDSNILAAQIAALTILGKVENREAFDDFATEEGKGISEKFFKFLDEIDERNSRERFKDGANADELLVYIGTTNAKIKTAEWKKIIEDAKDGSEEALDKVKVIVGKLHTFYSSALSKLRTHFAKSDEDDIDSEFQM